MSSANFMEKAYEILKLAGKILTVKEVIFAE